MYLHFLLVVSLHVSEAIRCHLEIPSLSIVLSLNLLNLFSVVH
mgnify:CR=1 FL=1